MNHKYCTSVTNLYTNEKESLFITNNVHVTNTVRLHRKI